MRCERKRIGTEDICGVLPFQSKRKQEDREDTMIGRNESLSHRSSLSVAIQMKMSAAHAFIILVLYDVYPQNHVPEKDVYLCIPKPTR